MARAIENQSYVIGVNRVGEDGNGVSHNGCSMIVDPRGNVIYNTEGVESVHIETLDLEYLEDYRRSFPAYMDADDFTIGT